MKALSVVISVAVTLPLTAQNAADVAQAFARNCTGCHSGSSKVAGLNLQRLRVFSRVEKRALSLCLVRAKKAASTS